MFLLLDTDDVVLRVSPTIGYQENGNVLVDGGTLAYAAILVAQVVEVDAVPDGVEAMRYCYTSEAGFYANVNWVDPNQPADGDTITPDEIDVILNGGE